MSEQQANRMSFLFFCGSGKAKSVCCCTLRTGSYVLSVLSILIYLITLFSNNNKSSPIFSIVMAIIKLIIQIVFIISICKFNFQMSYFVWIVDTIFTYITIIGGILIAVLTIVAGGSVGSSAAGVIAFVVVILILTLAIVIYLNYVIYSVSKTIGLNQKEELDGGASHVADSSERMI